MRMVLAKVLTSEKREKATAKADARRAVTEKTKPITQFCSAPEGSTPEVAADLECRIRLQQHSAFSFGPGVKIL